MEKDEEKIKLKFAAGALLLGVALLSTKFNVCMHMHVIIFYKKN